MNRQFFIVGGAYLRALYRDSLRARLHYYTTLLPNIVPKAVCTEHHNFLPSIVTRMDQSLPEINR
jgi:hypothetical protein